MSDLGNSNNWNGASYGWRWKPVDLAVLAIAFVAWWPLGIAVLAWKLWNDRQPVPQDLGQWIQTGATKLQQGFDSLVSGFGSGSFATGPEMTGNAAFDAHVREEWARIEADRRKLQDEIAAFKSFLASERSGDHDAYERFRRRRG
ncbi:MAG: DUF2852 domain-containing protein [Alsobacter sp.]